jgi:hypothetical protein
MPLTVFRIIVSKPKLILDSTNQKTNRHIMEETNNSFENNRKIFNKLPETCNTFLGFQKHLYYILKLFKKALFWMLFW